MNDLSPTPLLVTHRDGVATLTLNRPAQYNALSDDLLAALKRAIDTLLADRDVRCVVLAAAGKAFCAGHDLREMHAGRDETAMRALFARCSAVMQGLRALPVPVIAQVQGIAVAAGCQLVAACDLAVAARSARFAVSGINLGLFCSTPAVALSRNVATKTAFDMLFTGRFVDADEAAASGLVNRVVEDAGLGNAVASYAAEICGKSAEAVRIGKRMFYAQQEMTLADAYRYAGEVMACNLMTDDAQAGIGAFVGKAKAR